MTKKEPPWWFPGWPSLREVVTSVVGVGILVFTAAVLWPNFTAENADGIGRGKDILAGLGSIVGTVVGFYFGAKSGEDAAKGALARVVDTKAVGAGELKGLRAMVEELRKPSSTAAGVASLSIQTSEAIEQLAQRIDAAEERIWRA